MDAPDEPLSLRVDELLDALASGDRWFGSGTFAALVIALAASLVAMTVRHAHPDWEQAGGALAQADLLRVRVMPLAGADAEAWREASIELRSPDTRASHKRDERLGSLLARAAATPLQIAEVGADVAELAAVTAEHVDVDLHPDVAGAALFAAAGTRAAARLVDVNLATTQADARIARANQFAARASSASQRALELRL